ncbi:MAG: DUF3578 domain-containing protein [Treponema sp.]|nr:DUF3578 domain-containing protein [Treponema sp.]
MRQYLESIFQLGYTQYKGQGTGNGTDVQKSIKELTNNISQIAFKSGFQTEFSVGIGRWSAVPWIRVFYSDISPSAQDGVYIVYLFAASGNSAFITLNQGTTDSSNEKRNRIRKRIQEKISSRQFLKNQGNLSFGDNKNYGKAAMFYKEYQAKNLPSEEELKTDLQSMLEIYKECRDKGLLANINTDDIEKIITENPEDVKQDVLRKILKKDFNILDFSTDPLHTSYIRSLLSKPFVILSGNSGTGKTRIATRFAKYLEKKTDAGVKNHLLIPVGADWTDNTKILGYYNPLADNGAGKYEKTDVFKFIELAGANPEIPFFLILDEMNLSHVERYFSDFLSKMELVDYKNQDKKTYFDIPGYGLLEFPKNLFITGTVNIDETTYMFSPKVLDRANVIEFKLGKDTILDTLLSDNSNNETEPSEPNAAESFMKLANEVRSGEIPENTVGLLNEIHDILDSFYTELEKFGFEFAYRTIKEIRLYTIATCMTAEGEIPTATQITDIQILQKVLPKIHGNRKQIGDLLENLEKLAVDNNLENSLKKIQQMKDRLNRFQYASFI